MPFGPGVLPWWGWLLAALVALVVCVLSVHEMDSIRRYTPDEERELLGCGCLALLSGVVAFVAGLIGVVRLVRWAFHG